MQNNLSYLPVHKMFYSNHRFENKIEFSHFTIVQMVATKLDRVGRLDAGLQQDPLVQTFWSINNIDIKHQ